jgi:hypothetical protein
MSFEAHLRLVAVAACCSCVTGVEPTTPNPVPHLESVEPSALVVGAPDPLVTLVGEGFTSDAVARWNGAERGTTFESETRLRVSLEPGDVVAAGSGTLTVVNPAPGRRSSISARARRTRSGCRTRSTAVCAIVRPATSMPFVPIDVPPAATACHECAVVPGTHVAVLRPAVGTFQLTSPTSVDAEPVGAFGTNGLTVAAVAIAGASSGSDRRSTSAKRRSSSE